MSVAKKVSEFVPNVLSANNGLRHQHDICSNIYEPSFAYIFIIFVPLIITVKNNILNHSRKHLDISNVDLKQKNAVIHIFNQSKRWLLHRFVKLTAFCAYM